MRMGEPTALLHQAGQHALRRGPWWVLRVVPRALSVVEIRQDRLITARSSMLAMTFIVPPPVSQISISILNTRFRRLLAQRMVGGANYYLWRRDNESG